MLESQKVLGNFKFKKYVILQRQQNIVKIFWKVFEKLPFLAVENSFSVHNSPFDVKATSLNAHKPIIFQIGK
jgi:hypothetical protein